MKDNCNCVWLISGLCDKDDCEGCPTPDVLLESEDEGRAICESWNEKASAKIKEAQNELKAEVEWTEWN